MNHLLTAVLLFTGTTASKPQSVWPQWTHYAENFVQQDGRVVDHDREGLTTSEGQSYAMFFALVANDPERFDRLYRWTASNLAAGRLDQQLPAWSWGTRSDGTQGIKDANSASDGDIWIAFDLIQAGRLWKRSEYTAAGGALLKLIAQKEVCQVHGLTALLPGQTGFEHDGTVTLNPSYMPLFVLQSAARSQPAGPWSQIAASLPGLLHGGSIVGFASDWIQVTRDGKISPSPSPDKPGTPATGSYDAIRVYLWGGLSDKATPGRNAVLKELSSMTAYMQDHAVPPEFVIENPPHMKGDGPISYSAALIPFLRVSAPGSAAQQERRLGAAWSPQSGAYGNPPRYYDQNLAMFALGFTEHRYRISDTGDLEVAWQR